MQKILGFFEFTVGVPEANNEPVESDPVHLIQLYPNPVRDFIQLSYDLSNAEKIHIQLFSLDGGTELELLNTFQDAGHYTYRWAIGSKIGNGIYLIKIQVGERIYFEKIILSD